MGDALPTVDLGTGRTALAISAGRSLSTCAILDDRTVKCWGDNGQGALGLGDQNTRGDQPGEMGDNLPTVNLGTGRTALAISTSVAGACAILDNGSVKCWGRNSTGQLGLGDTNNRGDTSNEMGDNLPSVNLGTGRTAISISARGEHACAVLDDGSVKCWGHNIGTLGLGDTTDRGDNPGEMGDALPAVALGTSRTALTVSTGSKASCVVLDSNTVKCWGFNSDGQLGLGTTDTRGDGPGEMGNNLPAVDLDGNVASPAVRVTLTADRTSLVAGRTITYTVTVANTGGKRLSTLRVAAPDVPACARSISSLAINASVTYTCAYVTTSVDLPQMSNRMFVTSRQGANDWSRTVRTRVDKRIRKTDALVRLGTGDFVGNNVYNSSGSNQSASTAIAGSAKTFTVRIQNDGNAGDTFTVKGLANSSKFVVVYKRGATDITSQVVAGTYSTGAIAAAATHDITVSITAKSVAAAGDSVSRTITVTGTSGGTVDAVVVKATRS